MRLKQLFHAMPYRYFIHIGVSQMPDFTAIEQRRLTIRFVRCNAVISQKYLLFLVFI